MAKELPGNELHYKRTLCQSNATLCVCMCAQQAASVSVSISYSLRPQYFSVLAAVQLCRHCSCWVAQIVWLLQFCVILFAYFVSGLNINATTTRAASTQHGSLKLATSRSTIRPNGRFC